MIEQPGQISELLVAVSGKRLGGPEHCDFWSFLTTVFQASLVPAAN
jgi:hypothetical protein